jgi:hypothetical protein
VGVARVVRKLRRLRVQVLEVRDLGLVDLGRPAALAQRLGELPGDEDEVIAAAVSSLVACLASLTLIPVAFSKPGMRSSGMYLSQFEIVSVFEPPLVVSSAAVVDDELVPSDVWTSAPHAASAVTAKPAVSRVPSPLNLRM